MDAFLLNRGNEKWLEDSSPAPVRPVVSWKMVGLAVKIGGACVCMLFPAGFFLMAALVDDNFSSQAITGISIVAALGLLAIACVIRSAVRDYRLIRYGRVLVGEVIACKAVTSTQTCESSDGTASGGSWTETKVTVDYAFVSPAGSRIAGTVTKTHQEPPLTLPQEGESMAVLYLDDQLHEVL